MVAHKEANLVFNPRKLEVQKWFTHFIDCFLKISIAHRIGPIIYETVILIGILTNVEFHSELLTQIK